MGHNENKHPSKSTQREELCSPHSAQAGWIPLSQQEGAYFIPATCLLQQRQRELAGDFSGTCLWVPRQGLTSLLDPSIAVLAPKGCRDREGSAALWHRPVTLPSHLAHSIADPQVSDAVLRAVAATLKTYPFDFRGAKILSGEEEGVFGWVTANYLLENFIKRGWLGEWIQPQKKTLGAMDFGGASTQITFETRDTIENPRNKVMLKLYGQAYKVYTHSFLCYGRDQVLKRLLSKLLQAESYQATVSHPCWPMGYNKSLLLSSIYDSPCTEKERPSLALNTTVTLVGTGNGNLCALHVSKLFDFTNCSFSHCSFDGVFQPKVSGNFIAFSAFFYTVDFIQTVMGRPMHLPSDLKDAAEAICATSWSELLQKAPKLEKRLPDYCAVSTFVYLLTIKGYSFNNHSFPNIAFQKKVSSTKIHPHPMGSLWSQAKEPCRRDDPTQKKSQAESRKISVKRGRMELLSFWRDLLGN
ncbi:hypothetical protein Nmel_016859 [Mimus melanotis]